MRRGLLDFLRGTASGGHGVHVYADVHELAESAGAYLAAGFEAGEPAVIVATREHLAAFAERLEELGWGTERLEHEGLLVVVDADSALQTIMRDGQPSPLAFEAVVGTLLDEVEARFPGASPRVFGDMVDRLCEQDRSDAAVTLEELWNGLASSRRFSLLCGYDTAVFDGGVESDALREVCRLHSHVLSALPTA